MNAEYHNGITVMNIKEGKALLHYNVLPDGNVDDLSQHSGKVVHSGTKWIAHLWIWDPIIN